jgi:chromosome segregation ATPase
VYERVGNQWVKRDERTWSTDDAPAAHNYKDQVDAKQPRWTATTNAPKASQSPSAPASGDQAANADLAAFERDMDAYNRDRRAFNQEAIAHERDRRAVQSELDAVDREGLAFNELSDAQRTDARLDALNRRKANAERRAQQVIARKSDLQQREAELDSRKAELAKRAEKLGGVLETRP